MKETDRYDAILIHALGNKATGKTPDRLTPRSRLAVRAAVQLDPDGTATYVVSGGKFHDTRPTAFNTEDELMRRYHVPENRIIITTDRPATTSAEIRFLEEQANQHPEWKNLAHVSLSTHTPSMIALRRLWAKGRSVEFRTAENVLEHLPSERNSQRYKKFFSKLHFTIDEFIWRAYELAKFPFLLFPPTEKLLNKFASRWRPQITKS